MDSLFGNVSSPNVPADFFDLFLQQNSSSTMDPPMPPLTAGNKLGVRFSSFGGSGDQQTAALSKLATTTTPPASELSAAKLRRSMPSKKANRLLILVRILMMDLDRNRELKLKAQVKIVIRECNKHHRKGDAGFAPLNEAIEALVKATIGEARWARSTRRLDTMLLQRKQRYLS